MTEPKGSHEGDDADNDDVSLLALGSVLLLWRRTIIVLGLFGALGGLAAGLTSKRVYSSGATFIPQVSEVGATSELALAASQFGIRVPTSGGTWGPSIYVELLNSPVLLEPIAQDTILVMEQGGRRVAVIDLLQVEAPSPAQRRDRTVRALRALVSASEDKKLGAVRLLVLTQWPSVSLALAERLVRGVNRFNLETRKSQAGAERQFVDAQALEAERVLRAAEDRLQSFMQQNRAVAGAPGLAFERDRLQREVMLRQQVYTSLLQNREEARMREVRDTPVLTVLEEPRLPVTGESRKTVQKAVLGGLVGGVLGTLIAFLAHAVAAARQSPTEDAREFFQLVEEAVPRVLRRRLR